MSVEQVKGQLFSQIKTIGKNVLAALYPDELELYITALELVNSDGKTVEYFLFPLNPTSISESQNQILNIRKTAGGISTISTETFMPSTINLSGDFGRKLKILSGHSLSDFKAFTFSEKPYPTSTFSNSVKTGYGCIKILKKIIEKSSQLDENGKPYSLYLYNLNFGDIYLVKCINQPTYSCNIERNMIWQYNITFQTLARIDQIKDLNQNMSNLKLLLFSQIQKSLNVALANVSNASFHKNPDGSINKGI